jgi:hypothetical protein
MEKPLISSKWRKICKMGEKRAIFLDWPLLQLQGWKDGDVVSVQLNSEKIIFHKFPGVRMTKRTKELENLKVNLGGKNADDKD